MDFQQMPKHLAAKMAKTMLAVDRIKKNGRNSFHDYKYATEDAIAEAVREELASNNVAFFPTVLRDSLEKYEVSGSKQNQTNTVHRLWMAITWVDAETGESWTAEFPGEGQDNADKGLYKAMTGAIKYALLKTFLLPTGDDPEQMNDVERQATEARQGRQDRQQQRQAGPSTAGGPRPTGAPAAQQDGVGQPNPTGRDGEDPQGVGRGSGPAPVGAKVYPSKVKAVVEKAAKGDLTEHMILMWVQTNIRPVQALTDLGYKEFERVEAQVDKYLAKQAAEPPKEPLTKTGTDN